MFCRAATALLLTSLTLGCSSEEPAPPACDARCLDSIAARAVRETVKLVYNLTLQANPVGAQDESTDCPFGGSARVFGTATSDPVHGATEVELTYELADCVHVELDEEPEENYAMKLTGSFVQAGVLAVQPTATTALLMHSDALAFDGTVSDPPVRFVEPPCEVVLGQSGNDLSGTLCGRPVGVDLGGPQN